VPKPGAGRPGAPQQSFEVEAGLRWVCSAAMAPREDDVSDGDSEIEEAGLEEVDLENPDGDDGDEEGPDEAELDEDSLEAPLGSDDDDDDGVDDEEEDADGEEEAAPTTRTKKRTDDEEEDDDDLLSPDDVEADLDRILKDRMVTVEEEEDEDEGELETDERGESVDRLQPKRADEQLCPSCFLLVRASAPACPVGDDACPIFS